MTTFTPFLFIFIVIHTNGADVFNATETATIDEQRNETFTNNNSTELPTNLTQKEDGIPDGIKVVEIDTAAEPPDVQPSDFDENDVFPESHSIVDVTLSNTSLGYVRGQSLTTATGKHVDQYLGIPFAEPPTGMLRFRQPAPKMPWSGVLNAWTPPNSCMQTVDTYLGEFAGATMWNANTALSEDCLYLNIWVPKPRPLNAPVLVWIYGGGFYTGTNSLDIYNGSILASEENIIVVSVQYRLGAFGFLYLGTEDAPGNQGLLDQVLALQWIQDNIANFGGHPKYVTLFGQSAGAACVGLHLLAPKSSPLFMQAILQSGAPTADWVSVSRETALNRSTEFANRLDCPSEPKDALECMRRVEAQKLVDDMPTTGNMFDYYFGPVVDGEFLPFSPVEILKHGGYKRTNIMLGTTSNEGTTSLVYVYPEVFGIHPEIHVRKQDFLEGVTKLFPNLDTLERNALTFLYTDWSRPEDSTALTDNLEKMIGEKYITCDVAELASIYSAAGSGVFMYEFAHRSENSPWPEWMGVQHNHEIQYVFGRPLNGEEDYSEEEKNLSRRMMNYWANFARTGNPSLSSSGAFVKHFWPVHTLNGKEYFRITADREEVHRGLRAAHCAFWKKYLPELSASLNEMAAANVAQRQQCSSDDKTTEVYDPNETPDLLEIEDDWAMEFQEWKRDHLEWKREFAKYQEILETSRRLYGRRPTDEL